MVAGDPAKKYKFVNVTFYSKLFMNVIIKTTNKNMITFANQFCFNVIKKKFKLVNIPLSKCFLIRIYNLYLIKV